MGVVSTETVKAPITAIANGFKYVYLFHTLQMRVHYHGCAGNAEVWIDRYFSLRIRCIMHKPVLTAARTGVSGSTQIRQKRCLTLSPSTSAKQAW